MIKIKKSALLDALFDLILLVLITLGVIAFVYLVSMTGLTTVVI
jgi:hypothetical protein